MFPVVPEYLSVSVCLSPFCRPRQALYLAKVASKRTKVAWEVTVAGGLLI